MCIQIFLRSVCKYLYKPVTPDVNPLFKIFSIGRSPIPPKKNSQIDKPDSPDSYRDRMSIPEATNRNPVILIVVDTVDIAIAIAQVAAQGGCCIGLRRTPPVAEAANNVERSIGTTVAARQACETAAISSSCIRSCPMGDTGFFHRSSGN